MNAVACTRPKKKKSNGHYVQTNPRKRLKFGTQTLHYRFYHCTKLHSNLTWGAPSTGGWIDQGTDTAACDLKGEYQRRGGEWNWTNVMESFPPLNWGKHFIPCSTIVPSFSFLQLEEPLQPTNVMQLKKIKWSLRAYKPQDRLWPRICSVSSMNLILFMGRRYVGNIVCLKSHDSIVNSFLVMNIFLDASSHLSKRVWPLVGRSVWMSVCP